MHEHFPRGFKFGNSLQLLAQLLSPPTHPSPLHLGRSPEAALQQGELHRAPEAAVPLRPPIGLRGALMGGDMEREGTEDLNVGESCLFEMNQTLTRNLKVQLNISFHLILYSTTKHYISIFTHYNIWARELFGAPWEAIHVQSSDPHVFKPFNYSSDPTISSDPTSSSVYTYILCKHINHLPQHI